MSLSLYGKSKENISDLSVEDLRKELLSLRSQVEKLTGKAVSQGGAELRRLRDSTSSHASDLLRDGETMFGDVSREVGRELRLVERRARETVRERPAETVAVAIGLGLVIAYLWRR